MHAVIRSGGKQFRVAEGEVLRLPLLNGEVGGEIEFSDVLQVSADDKLHVGTPALENAKVKAKILRHAKGPKIDVYKFKRRKGYEKRRGHRQDFTEVRIEGISV